MARKVMVNGYDIGYIPPAAAADVEYDNTTSGLAATQVQSAIDEIASGATGIVPHLIIISETGSVVTATKGQTVITAVETSTGHFECDVPEFGTWLIDAVLGGDDAQLNLVVDTVKIYTVDDSHFHADITVTYPSGAQVSCSDGQTTLYATSSPYTFTVHNIGVWTVTASLEGETDSKSFTVTTTGQTFSWTALTFNYLRWLELGGVTGTYADLDAVFADEEAVRRLMLVHASVDYLVDMQMIDNTTIDAFVANDTAMKWIGLCDYACDELTSLSGVEAKFLASQYWERYLKDHVPTMTSNTAPYGSCISNAATISNHYAYTAFDNNDSTNWACSDSSGVANSYIGYYFTNPICVNKVFVKVLTSAQAYSFKVQHSDDNSTWIDTDGLTHQSSADGDYFDVENSSYHLYWRIIIPTAKDTDNTIALQFYGRSLNVSVPVMTSNTAPYGEVIYNAVYSTNEYPPYKMFDGDDSTRGATNGAANAYCGFDFKTAVRAKMAVIYPQADYAGDTVRIQGYDGSTWENVSEAITTLPSSKLSVSLIAQTGYTKYRVALVNKSTGYSSFSFYTVQFYGVDYSEKEFETGTTKKWLYDHGLKLDSNITTLRGTVVETSNYAVVRDTGNTAASYGFNSIDLSPYALSRAKTTGFTSNGGKSVIVGSTSSADAYTLFSSTNSPNNVALDISAINTTKALFFQADSGGGNIVELLVTEWWLE